MIQNLRLNCFHFLIPDGGLRVPDGGRIILLEAGLRGTPCLTSSIISSWFLLFYAKLMQDSFMLFVAFISHLYCNNSSTISLLPSLHANIKGVLPKLSFRSISAPNSIRLRTQVYLFFSMARDRGVRKSLSSGSTSEPRLMRAKSTWSEPAREATCIGVFPWFVLSLNVMFTSRPCSK